MNATLYDKSIHGTPPEPPPQKRTVALWVPVVTAIVGATLGGALMTGAQAQSQADEAHSSEACMTALGYAEDAFGYYQAGFMDVAEVLEAYESNDWRTMRTGNDRFSGRIDEIETTLIDYWVTSDACRAAYQE